jgi:ketosteroid isomerase-like protein
MGGPEWRAWRFTTGWLVGSAVSVLVTTSVAPGRAVAQTAAAAVVEAREIAFAQTLADRDLDAFLTFVSPEAIFFAGNEPLRGRDAVARTWAPFFEGPVAPFSWHPDVVQVLDSGDLALSSGPVRGPDGEEVGRFNSIWRRDADGQWLVVFDKGS